MPNDDPFTASNQQLTPRAAGSRWTLSLEAAATFGFGPTEGQPLRFDGAMRLAFPVDGGSGYAGAVLRQSAADQETTVERQSTKTADPELALKQIARIISIDYDGNEFLGVGERDRIIAELQTRFHDSFAADVDGDLAAFMADSQVGWGVVALGGAARTRASPLTPRRP